MPKLTPFHARTSELCEGESWQEWSGYLSADSYELDHSYEYNAVRMGCGLFDISPLYKYHVRGRDALALLNRMVTRDVSKCRVGQVIYTAWCDDDGKIVDDGTIARLAEDFFRITTAISTLHWLQDVGFGMQVEVEDVSDEQGALALQGPTSKDLLQELTSTDLDSLRYFRILEDKIAGIPVRLSRTGYTGDLGYELFVEPENAHSLWDALMEKAEAYKLRPAGTIALDMVRIEAALILIDAEFTSASQAMYPIQRSTPYELGLDWVINLKKDSFIGQRALREEYARGPAWTTVGIQVDVVALEALYNRFGMPLMLPYQSWIDAIPLYLDGRNEKQIGKATSGMWSPTLKLYLALARIKPEYAKSGTRIHMEATIEGQRFSVPATVVDTPFFDPPRKRA
jgi:aminomethyltransferase